MQYYGLAQTSLNPGFTQGPATPSQVVNSAYDTSGSGGRKLVLLSGGELVAAVKQTTSYILYISRDHGITWNLFLTVATTSTQDIALVPDQNDGVYILSAYNNNTLTFKHVRSDGTVSVSSTVDSGQTAMANCSFAVDSTGDSVYAVWTSKNSTYGNAFNVRWSRSTDGGNTWSTPVQYTASNTTSLDNRYPCMVITPDNTPHFFYIYTTPLLCVNWTGTTFSSTTVTVATNTNTSYPMGVPSVVADPTGAIHIAFAAFPASSGSVYLLWYTKSTDGGNTWSTRQQLAGSGYSQLNPSIVVDGSNNPHIFWNAVVSTISPYQQIQQIDYNGSSWGSIINVTQNGIANAQYPQAFYGSDGVIRYIYQDGVANQITYDASPRPTKLFSTKPVELKIPLWWADGTEVVDGGSYTSSGSNFIADSGSYSNNTVISSIRLHTLNTNWPASTMFAFEVTMYCNSSSGTAYAELWDFTAGVGVSSSQVSTTSTTAIVVRSGQVTLTPGHLYGVTVWQSSNSLSVEISDASLIVFPS